MEFIENSVLGLLDFEPIFFYRYVDDIVTAVPRDKIDRLLHIFNNFDKNIKFTIEIEKENQLPFLDLVIIRNDDGSLSTDWYHKSTWSGRYLNYHSHLPQSYKRNTISLLTEKIIHLSDPVFHQKNFELLTNTLLNNNYPISLIKSNIKRTLHKLTQNCPEDQSVVGVPSERDLSTNYISLPYVKELFEKIKYCLSKYNFRVVGRGYNSFGRSVFSNLKDPIDIGNNTNVVYKVTCECSQSYVGKTTQLLKTRIYQHKNDASKLRREKREFESKSALSVHLAETSHDFHLNNVEVLEKESNCRKLGVLEMIHIKRNTNSLNKQSDSEHLHDAYNIFYN